MRAQAEIDRSKRTQQLMRCIRWALLLTAACILGIVSYVSYLTFIYRPSPPPLVRELRASGQRVKFVAKSDSIWYLRLVDIADLTVLAENVDELESLQKLNISNSPLTDLSPLGELAGLRDFSVLTIRDTQVTDLSPLTKLQNLRKLVVDQSPVSDLSPLVKLTGLRSLVLSETNVTAAEVARLQRALPGCEVELSSIE